MLIVLVTSIVAAAPDHKAICTQAGLDRGPNVFDCTFSDQPPGANPLVDLANHAAALFVFAAKANNANAAKNGAGTTAAAVEPAYDARPGFQGTPADSAPASVAEPCRKVAAGTSFVSAPVGSLMYLGTCVNPLGLTSSDSAQSYAFDARLFDVGVVVPVELAAIGEAGGQPIKGAGLRIRANALGGIVEALGGDAPFFRSAFEANRLIALQLVDVPTAAYNQASTRLVNALADFLARETDASGAACLRAVSSAASADIETSCGDDIAALAEPVLVTRTELFAALDEVKTQADTLTGGLDLRVDIGDVQGSGLRGSRDVSLVADLAAAIRFPISRLPLRIPLSLRGGVIGNDLKSQSLWQFGGHVALGTGLALVVDGREYSVTGAIDLMGTSDYVAAAAGTPLDGTAALRFGVQVPLLEGALLGVAGAVPLSPNGTPSIALTGDWAALESFTPGIRSFNVRR